MSQRNGAQAWDGPRSLAQAFEEACGSVGFGMEGVRVTLMGRMGYGMVAKRDIGADETLLSVPQRYIITPTRSFEIYGYPCHSPPLTPHQSLAHFVLHLAVHHDPPSPYSHAETRFWKLYRSMLPASFDTVAMDMGMRVTLTVGIREGIKDMWGRVKADWVRVRGTGCRACRGVEFEVFRWAWLVVNTRSVMIPGPDSRRCEWSLIPLFDLLNHKPITGAASTSLTFTSGRQSLRLTTHIPCPASDQLFITYGPHPNSLLLTHYGFTIPSNPFPPFIDITPDITRMLSPLQRQAIDESEGWGGFGWSDGDGEMDERTLRVLKRVLGCEWNAWVETRVVRPRLKRYQRTLKRLTEDTVMTVHVRRVLSEEVEMLSRWLARKLAGK